MCLISVGVNRGRICEANDTVAMASSSSHIPHRKLYEKTIRPQGGSNFIEESFPQPKCVTSDLVPRSNLRDHGRGRDGRLSPHRRAPKSFVLPILVSKSFRLPILPRFSR